MSEQKELFGFHDMRPKITVKKMIDATRIKEAIAQRNASEKDQVIAMRNFREDLERFERRIKNK